VSHRAAVVAVAVATALAGAACGGGGTGSGSGGGASCTPNGTALNLLARNTTFDAGCLAAPAGTAFTIDLDNQDPGVPHSVSIFSANPSSDSNAQELFKGQVVSGPTQITYHVQALPAGTYHFQCAVHPSQMNGTLVVE
jgi:plastocyanin